RHHWFAVHHPAPGLGSAPALHEPSVRPEPVFQCAAPSDGPTLRPSAELKHVVYIILENRTYDQVFGDVARGNGDARLAIFDNAVTPNAHAIAGRWVLFDNFYVNGEVSADGHEWTDRAFASDYNEKTWPQIDSNRR